MRDTQKIKYELDYRKSIEMNEFYNNIELFRGRGGVYILDSFDMLYGLYYMSNYF